MRAALVAAGLLVAATVAAHVALQPLDDDAGKRALRYAAAGPSVAGLLVLFAACVAHAFRFDGRMRRAMLLLALALAGQLAGETFWLAANLSGTDAPRPSLADAGWLAFGLFALLGTATLMGRPGSTVGGEMAVSMGWALFVLVGSLGALVPRLNGGDATGIATALHFAYPVADVVAILLLGLAAARLPDDVPARPVQAMLAGLALAAVGHLGFALAAEQGALFTGDWTRAAALAGVALFGLGLASFEPREARAPDERVPRTDHRVRPAGPLR